VFSFSGNSDSGIRLMATASLPNKGFCFCGSIYIERKSQTCVSLNSNTYNIMTIFKLYACTNTIELFIEDGYLKYKVNDANKIGETVIVSKDRLKEGKWYFIELYHFITKEKDNLKVYVDSNLSCECPFRKYDNKVIYHTNTIGCSIDLYKDKDCLKDNFHGEMTALCFIETSYEKHKNLRSFLYSRHMKLESIIENTDLIIREKGIYMFINPRFETPTKVACVVQKHVERIEIIDQKERLYPGTIVHHNVSARETFINIGGLKTLIPALQGFISSDITLLYTLSVNIEIR